MMAVRRKREAYGSVNRSNLLHRVIPGRRSGEEALVVGLLLLQHAASVKSHPYPAGHFVREAPAEFLVRMNRHLAQQRSERPRGDALRRVLLAASPAVQERDGHHVRQAVVGLFLGPDACSCPPPRRRR